MFQPWIKHSMFVLICYTPLLTLLRFLYGLTPFSFIPGNPFILFTDWYSTEAKLKKVTYYVMQRVWMTSKCLRSRSKKWNNKAEPRGRNMWHYHKHVISIQQTFLPNKNDHLFSIGILIVKIYKNKFSLRSAVRMFPGPKNGIESITVVKFSLKQTLEKLLSGLQNLQGYCHNLTTAVRITFKKGGELL